MHAQSKTTVAQCYGSQSNAGSKGGAKSVTGFVVLAKGLPVAGEVLRLNGGIEMQEARKVEPQIKFSSDIRRSDIAWAMRTTAKTVA